MLDRIIESRNILNEVIVDTIFLNLIKNPNSKIHKALQKIKQERS